MSDISKCLGHECEKKRTCYRFTAQSNPYRQAYAQFDIDLIKLREKDPNYQCEYYWNKDDR